MSTRITIRGLRALGTHGALPEEQLRPQPFILDLDVDYDASAAIASDELADALDYGAVAQQAARIVERERFMLLEGLAARVVDVIAENPRVEAVRVTIGKPEAALAADAEVVEVTIARRNRPGTVAP